MKANIHIICLFLIAFGIKPLFAQEPFEPNDTYETAASVTCGQQFSDYIQIAGDIDWYEIEMEESGVLEVTVSSVPDNINLDVGIYQIIDNVLTLIADDREPYPGGGENMFVSADVNAGSYLIKVNDHGNDKSFNEDAYMFCLDIITGIETPTAFSAIFNMYPNPCSEQLYINAGLNEDASQISIVLLDHLGREILQFENVDPVYSINVRELPAGLYFLRVLTNNGSFTQKVLIE